MATTRTSSPLARAGTRALVATLALAAVWAVAFVTSVLPFFPTIVVGGLLSGVAGWWVRRGDPAPAHGAGADDEAGPDGTGADGEVAAPRFPPLRVTGRQALLALAVAVVHLGVGHLLFALGSVLLPEITTTAAAVYGRAGSVPLAVGIVLGGLVTAPLEEVLWRGAVQPLTGPWLVRHLPWLPSVPAGRLLGTTALYTLFHVATGQVALVAAAALGGLVWGWLLDRTGSLGATMLAHAGWTTLMLLVPPAGT